MKFFSLLEFILTIVKTIILETLKEYVNHPKCIAVGECGLDYFRLPEDEDETLKQENIALQKKVFH